MEGDEKEHKLMEDQRGRERKIEAGGRASELDRVGKY